ncbi:MAG TPA: ABC transporter permease [Bryobacteraceae bacterium]|nr:ABC transporter permease [Bryobacteraceae bacterium]
MKGSKIQPVSTTLRLYRTLASAFPQEFRNVYGEELMQSAEDSIESIWRRYGVPGLVRLLVDISLRIPAEYMAELRQDIRFGWRRLAGSPGFTTVALVSLSLGICIATCAYSEMNGLLRDLPGVSKPEQLVAFQAPVSYPDYKRYRGLSDLFSVTFAYVAPVPLGVSLSGRTERIWGHLVTPSYFSTLDVRPLLGRVFDRQDEQPGAAAVVVSYRFWQEHLGADPLIVGKMLRINGRLATVIGVGPKKFLGASPYLFVSDIWLPVSVDPGMAPELAGNALEWRDLTMFQVVGRLRPGITEAAAEAELDAVAQQLAEANGEKDEDNKGHRVLLANGGKVLPLRKQDVPFFKEFLMVLGGLVLLIACINVANMMLARAADRRKEIAVRLALGASRGRLIRQLLTEATLVALGAAGPAFLLSVWLMRLMSRLKEPLPIPVSLDLTLDWRALVFTITVTGLAGIAFGLAPALQATRTDLTPALKEGGRVQLRRYRKLSLRNGLVVCQMAASLTLLLLTGYLGLGIQSTLGVQEGFNPRNLYLISLDPVRDGYSADRAADFLRKVLDRVKGLPGVVSACLTDTVPVAIDGNSGVRFWIPGSDAAHEVQDARRHMVGRGYFETAGIRILAGRGFREADEAENATAVVVSEELVRKYWPGEDVLGRRIEVRNAEAAPTFGGMPGTIDFRAGVIGNGRRVFEVVGVVKDVTEDIVANRKRPVVYFPLHRADYAQPSLRGVTLMIRAVPGVDVLNAVRREIAAIDSKLTPFNARSMTEQIAQFMSILQAASWTYLLIGVFGLILASVGLAGVTAYAVAQRGHEIGIRMALGAQKRNVLGLVMAEGAALVTVGTITGLALAWVGIRALSGLFFTVASVQSTDPVLLVGAPVLLAGVALAACYLPARKSMRIDPAVMLRQE